MKQIHMVDFKVFFIYSRRLQATGHCIWDNNVFIYRGMFEVVIMQFVTLTFILWFRWQQLEKEWHGSSQFLFCHWLHLSIWSS